MSGQGTKIGTRAGTIQATGAPVLSPESSIDRSLDKLDAKGEERIAELSRIAGVGTSTTNTVGGWTYFDAVSCNGSKTVELCSTLPSATVEVQILYKEMSTGSDNYSPMFQGGAGNTRQTTDYKGATNATTTAAGYVDGMYAQPNTIHDAADEITGVIRMIRYDPDAHLWMWDGAGFETTTVSPRKTAGNVLFTGALDSIWVSTSNDFATFDAGEARVIYR
jgi:hypothetical protein